MERVVLITAVIFVALAISIRHKFKREAPEENDNPTTLSESLKQDQSDSKSLSYALNQVTGNQPPPKNQPTQTAPEDLTKRIEKLVEKIQLANEDSAYAFEEALGLTSGDLKLKLTVLQGALSLQGENLRVRNAALKEVTSLPVADLSNANLPPDDPIHDLQRNVVTTAYKVYVQTSQDEQSVYNDTVQALNAQPDPWVRRQIIFECVSRFPQLREKLNE